MKREPLNWEVRPGFGVGSCRLGMQKQEIEAIYGRPSRTIVHESHDAGDITLAYDNFETFFYLFISYQMKLTTIECENKSTSFRKKPMIGLEIDEFMENHNYSSMSLDYHKEFLDSDLSWSIYHFKDLAISCYCQSDIIQSVQVTTFWDRELDEPIWPRASQ